MSFRVHVTTYRRLTVVLLGGGAMVAAGATLLLARDSIAAGAALGVAAIAMAGSTFALRVRGDLRGHVLLLLTRSECPACDEARRLLGAWQDEYGYDVWIVDVDQADAPLRDEFSARVPVVLHGGRVVADLDVQEGPLRAALASI